MTKDDQSHSKATPASGRKHLESSQQRIAVRDRYRDVATAGSSCCDDGVTACGSPADRAHQLGYSQAELDAVETGANLGLGCGNPTAIANLKEGETVLDLGAGAGFDCFLASREVGPRGQVIGVDMTPKMVEKARENVTRSNISNVEFRLGEIEHLPISDSSIDVILSNCVINLSPDKKQVFREAYRVLRLGGRVTISDIVSTTDLPIDLQTNPELVAACVGGASPIAHLKKTMTEVGFTDVSIEPDEKDGSYVSSQDDPTGIGNVGRDMNDYVAPVTIKGTKPLGIAQE